ncbi:MAG: hypothetical protein QGG74_06445 [Phycisphaerales bacterium]|jgi:hypothetical protein|nr:hypothetical protein [Phycisphaerales bacterium]
MLMIALSLILLGPTADSENAAHLYREAFEQLAAQSDEDTEQFEWVAECLAHWYPVDDGAIRAWRAANGEAVDQIVEASTRSQCDFGIDVDGQGFDALMPHLGSMMRGARLLEAAAAMSLQEGNPEKAIQYAEAAIRSAEYLQSDHTIIGSLISASIIDRLAGRITDTMVTRGQLTPDAARHLATRFASTADDRDPFGIAEAFRTEQRITQGWLKQQFGLDDPDLDPNTSVPGLIGNTGERWNLDLAFLPTLTVGQANAEFDRLSQALDVVIAAASNPNLETGLKMIARVEEDITRGEHGLLAAALMPAMKNLLERRNTSVASIRQRTGQFQALAAGRVDPAALVNGGRLWLEAGFIATEATQPWTTDAAAVDAIDALLDRSAVSKEATTPPVWEHRLEAAVPWWLPTMTLLVDGLLERLDRSLGDAEEADLAAHAAVLLRMVAALSNDPHLASSLVAADTLQRLAPLITRISGHPKTSPQDRRMLSQLVRTIPLRDPAGLQRAESETRTRLSDFLHFTASIDASLPSAADDLLPFIAWARGMMQSSEPDTHLVPTGVTADGRIPGIDTTALTTWEELGAAGGAPEGFSDLPLCDVNAAINSVPTSIDTIRSTLSE